MILHRNLIKLLLFIVFIKFHICFAMPIDYSEIVNDLALVQQPDAQFQAQLRIIEEANRHWREIGEAEKIAPDLTWIRADPNDVTGYTVCQILRMLSAEVGDKMIMLQGQVVTKEKYYPLLYSVVNNDVIFFDKIPGVYEALWLNMMMHSMKPSSIVVVLDDSNVYQELKPDTRATIDHIIDVRTDTCTETLAAILPRAL